MGMVNYKLCNKCYNINFAKVLYFQKRKVERWLHQIMQINNMYGNAKQDMDDKLHVQRIFIILQEVYSRWDFTN